jgi:pantothenate kinase
MIFGVREVESITNSDNVRSVLMFISIVIGSLVILLSRDVDLFYTRILLAIEKTTSLIF